MEAEYARLEEGGEKCSKHHGCSNHPLTVPHARRLLQLASLLSLLVIVLTSAFALHAVHAAQTRLSARSGAAATTSNNLEGADAPQEGDRSGWWVWLVEFAGAAAAVYYIGPRVMGVSLKYLIEKFDRLALSVDIHMEEFSLSLLRRSFSIKGLQVDNPQGSSWKSEWLLKADSVEVVVQPLSVIKSFGKQVELEKLAISNLVVNYELESISMNNVQPILDFLEGVKVDGEHRKIKTKKLVEYVLHEVSISEIQVVVRTPPPLSSTTPVDVKDIYFMDLANSQTQFVLQDVIRFLMRSVLSHTQAHTAEIVEGAKNRLNTLMSSARTSFGNLAGNIDVKAMENTLHDLEQRASTNFSEVTHKMGEAFNSVFHTAPAGIPVDGEEQRRQQVRSAREKTLPHLSALQKALQGTGLKSTALCPPDGLDGERLAVLASLTAAVDPAACTLEDLFLVLARGRAKMTAKEFERWLAGQYLP